MSREKERINVDSATHDGGNDPSKQVNRRAFIKRAGLTGVSAGLAHFVLLGASPKAWAEPCAPPYGSGGGNDICTPSQAGDMCGSPYTAAAGDECSPAYSAGDICDYGDGMTSSDIPT